MKTLLFVLLPFLLAQVNGSSNDSTSDGFTDKARPIKTFEWWGPNFQIEFDIKIKANATISDWHNVLHVTTGQDGWTGQETGGSRIPGGWLHPSDSEEISAYMFVQMEVNGTFNSHWHKLGYNDHYVELHQQDGNFSLIVNNTIEWSLPNGDQSYENVQFWLPDPWHLPAEDVAEIKNVVAVSFDSIQLPYEAFHLQFAYKDCYN